MHVWFKRVCEYSDIGFVKQLSLDMFRVQEFESFIGAYRDNLLSTRQTTEKLVNSNDPRSLKYVSKAYIER